MSALTIRHTVQYTIALWSAERVQAYVPVLVSEDRDWILYPGLKYGTWLRFYYILFGLRIYSLQTWLCSRKASDWSYLSRVLSELSVSSKLHLMNSSHWSNHSIIISRLHLSSSADYLQQWLTVSQAALFSNQVELCRCRVASRSKAEVQINS